jgi:hypothetical protein
MAMGWTALFRYDPPTPSNSGDNAVGYFSRRDLPGRKLGSIHAMYYTGAIMALLCFHLWGFPVSIK